MNTNGVEDGTRGKMMGYVYGPAVTPTALASQHLYTKGDIYVASASTAIAVPTGQSFAYVAVPTHSTPRYSCEYVAFDNSSSPSFGAWQAILTNLRVESSNETTYFPQTAASDGFLLASIDCSQVDGGRGYIELQYSEGGTYTRRAASSAHYYSPHDRHVPWNSFCVPIRHGTNWRLAYQTTSNLAIFNAWWIPFGASGFSGPVEVTTELTRATSDGFLSGYVYAPDGSRGRLGLYMGPTIDDTRGLGPNSSALRIAAQATAHQYSEGDVHIRSNSAMVPVKNGWYYRKIVETTHGTPFFDVRFTPAANLFA